ncbi:MAG: hypothetical protein H6523_15745 [Mycolicibacterium sp.]|jgi:hypothetical protein|uniref:Uncharacterized protein n=1 Tax=Mycolicibacterium insubricum TaxID=444597 RepID=A0A1X0D5P6_9MYCO|nr:hypothetical protein [Mycolicibacterium insubricum]MCB9441690.1 hypothetical protein [Mycolicibacterium sp.]MCV7080311.1 hypothetical protein [Mycolicibacterium insubricum]ORA67685.1 hypothetical protein BST26_15350 [Mycolicibacterium insubricum]
MGDYAQTLCDVDVTDAEADELKHRLLTWLVDKRVIRPELTDCGMSSAGGHAPGENYGYAIYGREDATLDPPRLWANGMEIDTGRRVYWGRDLERSRRDGNRHSEKMIEWGPWALRRGGCSYSARRTLSR